MISVEPAGHEFAGLEGTDLAISSDFVVEARRGAGRWLKPTVHIVNGRLECRELELSTKHGQIDSSWLHELGLAAVLQQAASHIARCLHQPTSDESWSVGRCEPISGLELRWRPSLAGGSRTARCRTQRNAARRGRRERLLDAAPRAEGNDGHPSASFSILPHGFLLFCLRHIVVW